MSETNKPELLPCPFCGGEAYLYDSVAVVECFQCGAKTVLKEHHEDIIADWNRRTPVAPQWTTEPPKEEGWYVNICRFTRENGNITQRIDVGFLAQNHLEFAKMSTNKNVNFLWFKLDVPPLPEGKESNE